MSKGVIVCVDDERLVLLSLRDQLTNYLADEYEIELAENGEEAIEIFDELAEEGVEIPLIICDQIMPEMRGDELLIELHNGYPKTLKILLTGQADANSVGNAVNFANLYRYISKPWDKTDLCMTVSEALRRYYQEAQLVTQAESLRQSETKLRAIVETATEGIITINQYGIIESFNPAAEQIFGYTALEIIGQNVNLLMPSPFREKHDEYMVHYQQTGQKYLIGKTRELLGQHKDGRIITLEISVNEIEMGDSKLFTGIVRDITERKFAEKERLKLIAIEQELSIAQEIHQNLLPSPYPKWPDLDAVCYSKPANEIGGDFYAYHPFNLPIGLPEVVNVGSYSVTIGDVSGKGIPAALLMAVSLAWFQAAVRQELSPSELLQYLDQALLPYTRPKRQNCALIYAEISSMSVTKPQRYRLRFANAGCIPPYILRHNGQVEHYEEAGGFALGQGLGSIIGYKQYDTELSKGDWVIFTSDGMVEANNEQNEMLGFERLKQMIHNFPAKNNKTANTQTMLHYLIQELFAFTGEAKQHDDITIIVIKI